jgi:transposase-like protein
MANASLDDSHQAGTYRRIELITGDAKRRIWTEEEKAQILAESFQPGGKGLGRRTSARHESRPAVDMASPGAEAWNWR